MIHSTASVHRSSKISKNVEIGPYCIIGPEVEIESNCILHSHISIKGNTKIGKNNEIFPFVSIGTSPQDLKYKGEKNSIVIGDNNKLREYVNINPGTSQGGTITRLGNNNLLMVYCHIAHDCNLGNNIVLANNVQVGGHVKIEDNAIIGGSCAIHQFSRIGQLAMVGGMTGVLSDVIPFGLSFGNRNNLVGLNLIGLRRAKISNEDIKILQKFYDLIFSNQNFRSNIDNLNADMKNNKYVKIIIDLSKNNKFKKDKNSYFINIGKFGKILELIKSKKCKKVLFAGNIIKPKISKLKLDLKGIYYIPRIIKASKLGDAAILKELIYILSENKIRVIKLNTYNPELTLSKGCYTKLKPNMIDKITIKKGIEILKKSNSFNHVQALVINNNRIVSFEKKKGTKDMLKSIRNNNLQNKLLLKMPKIKQDLRVDLPTIGLDTLKDCKKANIKGIIVKAGQNIFLDKQEAIKFANKNNIFVLAK